ncbi:MAG: HupE/UreJ family protein [Chthoniobacterales bacterium]
MISNFATSIFFAHAGHGSSSGFLHGLTHPVGGLDHILAMVAVGVWAAMLGGRAVWLVPVTFTTVMAIGSVIGMSGFEFPAIEPAIGASVMILGLLIMVAAKVPVGVAAGIVGFFALFHGAAHGAEMPFSVSAVAYSLGFLGSTAALHLVGVGLGAGMERVSPAMVYRTAGAAVAIVGGLLLTGVL